MNMRSYLVPGFYWGIHGEFRLNIRDSGMPTIIDIINSGEFIVSMPQYVCIIAMHLHNPISYQEKALEFHSKQLRYSNHS